MSKKVIKVGEHFAGSKTMVISTKYSPVVPKEGWSYTEKTLYLFAIQGVRGNDKPVLVPGTEGYFQQMVETPTLVTELGTDAGFVTVTDVPSGLGFFVTDSESGAAPSASMADMGVLVTFCD